MRSVSITRHSEPLPSITLRHKGVLQAFSQARKHRRHIHLATLRAQGHLSALSHVLTFNLTNFIVKKNAESQRDKLGPQWSSWVSKAVHRLVSLVLRPSCLRFSSR